MNFKLLKHFVMRCSNAAGRSVVFGHTAEVLNLRLRFLSSDWNRTAAIIVTIERAPAV